MDGGPCLSGNMQKVGGIKTIKTPVFSHRLQPSGKKYNEKDFGHCIMGMWTHCSQLGSKQMASG